MRESPWKKAWRFYGAVMAVMIVIAGALLIWQAVDIYRTGNAPENINEGVYIEPVYSREAVAEHFSRIALPVYACVGCVALGMLMWLASPAEQARPKASVAPEDTLRRLYRRVSEGAGKEQPLVLEAVEKERRLRRRAWMAAGAVAAVCSVISGIYLLNVEHFTSWDLERVMGDMMLAVTPWVALAFAALCVAAAVCRASVQREIPLARQLGQGGKPGQKTEPRKPWLPSVRVALYAAAIALVILGVMNGGMRDVLIKAINICTECIGLG